MNNQLIVNTFLKNETLKEADKYGNGHINQTYLFVMESGRKFIVQKINNNIFKDIDMLMNNINKVTDFLTDQGIETIRMLKTDNGLSYLKDTDGYYRMYEFIDNSMTFEKAESLDMVEDAANAFGKFHNDLAKLNGAELGEIIPKFHDTRKRYNDFLSSLKADKLGRLETCKKEADLIMKYEKLYSLIVDGITSGEVLLHVTHNDPKINNALFDTNTHQFRAVIDLDTVMPGSVLYDFGDALRSLCTGDKEDSKEYDKVVVNYEIYKHYLKAYYKQAKHFLTKREIELMPYAPFLLTMECGMRFLADYLDGDIYFATHREGHNLDRARTQINLACSMINNIDKLKEITKEIIENN